MRWTRLVTAVCAVGAVLFVAPGPAQADVQQGIGHTTPAQGYQGKPGDTDWLGSYQWRGRQVWCVQYSLLAPDSTEEYHDQDELRTKAGAPLSAENAANISYLLLRYSQTGSQDEAAALAHLLHSWTAFPQDGLVLGPDATFRNVAYDEAFHYNGLPQGAREAVDRLRADALANRGPWTLAVTEPDGHQIIGEPDTWPVEVAKSNGELVPGVPVRVELDDATLPDGSASGVLTSGPDGKLDVPVVPTGFAPSIVVKVASPADRPVVHVPSAANGNMQRIVTTGGEKELEAEASTAAVNAAGEVRVAKTDAETDEPIPGVALRVVAADGVSPAITWAGGPLVGEDGGPLVAQTAADGTLTVPELQTPQEVCLVEVAAPKGYEDAFDPNAPPRVCGVVDPGQTLTLLLRNSPNKAVIPIEIPAGAEGAGVSATAAFSTRIGPWGWLGFGAVALAGAAALLGYSRRPRRARS
ncbi:hypothetical protein [Actinosynnema sp. NPDC020468]|uniref:MSCRAMM family protein n=1 Tax=Actinosynnema sp. NPDC020468 TaxID=3154488 RepID=UPI003402F551